jgi:hypothetical protein
MNQPGLLNAMLEFSIIIAYQQMDERLTDFGIKGITIG